MPADRAKVLAALNAKFKGKSVDKNYKEERATAWAAKITDDEGIDDFINDREDDVLAYMKNKDAAVTAATAKTKQEAADAVAGKTDPKTDKPDEVALPADTPEWVKVIMKQQKDLADKVEGFEKAKTTETLTQKFHKGLKDAGVPDFAIKYAPIPKDESEIEGLQAQIVADFKPTIEQGKVSGFGGYTPPGGGAPSQKATGNEDAQVKAYAAKVVAAAQPTTTALKN